MRLSTIYVCAMLLALLPMPAIAASATSLERKVERAEKEVSEKQRELRGKRAELAKARQEITRVGKQGVEESTVRKARVAELADEVRGLEDDVRAAEDTLSNAEDARERAEAKERREKQAASRPATSDCVNCTAGRASTPNQGQSTWDGIAQVLKAVTPLGVAGMGTWLNYQGIQQQSSNYQFYANSMLSQGLPISAPSSYFGGSSGSVSLYGSGYGVSSLGSFSRSPSFSYGSYAFPFYFSGGGVSSLSSFGMGLPAAYPLTNTLPTVASAYRL